MPGPLDGLEWDDRQSRGAGGQADTTAPPAWYSVNWDSTRAAAGDAVSRVPGTAENRRRVRLSYAANDLARATGKPVGAYELEIPGAPIGLANPIDEAGLWRDLNAYRARNPGFLKDLGNDAADFETRLQTDFSAERAGRQARMARQGIVGNLIGGAVGSQLDPVNFAANFIGGPAAKGVIGTAKAVVFNGLVNAGVEYGETPFVRAELEAQGSQLTDQEASDNLKYAFVGGAGFTAGLKGLSVVGDAGAKQVSKAFNLDDRAAARALRQSVRGTWELDPQQAAALNVLERKIEVEDANPFQQSYAALDAHEKRLSQTLRTLSAMPQPRPPVSAPTSPVAPAGGFNSDEVLRFIVKDLEGGAKLVTDSGGLTKYGISANAHPGVDIAKLTEAQAMEIYRRQYVAPLPLAGKSSDVQLIAVDASINHGPGFARRLLATAGDDPVQMLAMRRAEYARLIAENPAKYARYQQGWENRLRQVEGRLGLPEGQAMAGDAIDAAPAAPDPALTAERPSVDIEQLGDIAPEPLEVRPEVMQTGLVDVLRPLLGDRSVSLGRVGQLADGLGVSESDLRAAMGQLVSRGELRQAKDGSFRRVAKGGNAGPEDMMRFIARRGGLSYDGFSEGQRARNLNMDNPPRGHDLKNSGNMDHFVPGGGKLLRPTGKGLDEMGEMLWEAGYFGPPDTTPRPTETELIALIDTAIGAKQKIYSTFDNAPADRRPTRKEATGPDPEKAGDEAIAGSTTLFPNEIRAVEAIMAEGSELLPPMEYRADLTPEELAPYLIEMVNREIDDVLDSAHIEIEDPFYDLFPDGPDGQARAGGESGQGSAPDAGNARPGEAGAEAGRGPESLSPAERDALEAEGLAGPVPLDDPALRQFDEGDGDGIKAASDSIWHDLRQMQAQSDEALPDGSASGPFGTIHRDVDPDDWGAVVDRLSQAKSGEVPGALSHPEIGRIDVPWGKPGTGHNDGFGLSKIVEFHPEVLADLPAILRSMRVIGEEPKGYVQLRSPDHAGAVRLDWDGKSKTWLLTAFEQRGKAPSATDFTRAADGAQAGNFPALEADPEVARLLAESKPAGPLVDLDDGKGPRPIGDIDAELKRGEDGLDAIRGCL